MENVKEIPYGFSNFVEVMRQNMYFVDKTQYLPLLESQPRNLFLIRPRRFGKSIFLSMMSAYYDIVRKDEFRELFGSLWIGSHPTPLQGKYQIMSFDFSRAGAGMGNLEENFNAYCSICIDAFAEKYAAWYKEGFAEEQIHCYAQGPKVQLMCRGTKLHCIVMQFSGWELARMEEV